MSSVPRVMGLTAALVGLAGGVGGCWSASGPGAGGRRATGPQRPAAAYAGPNLPDDSVAVDLTSHLQHDLFGGKFPPLLMIAQPMPSPWTPPIPLDFDPAASPDAVLLRAATAPDAPLEVRIPVGASARTLYFLTAAQGGLDVRDIVADGEIVYADGRTQGLKWMVGEHAWPAWAGATGRTAEAIPLGVNPSGDLLTASLLTVVTSFPAVPIDAIVVRSRPGPLAFALLEIRRSTQPPRTQGVVDARPDDVTWYDFDVRRPPELAPVRGPVTTPLTLRDGHFWNANGTRARPWGVNLVGKGALPPVGEAEAWADQIARAGFDLVRLHHLDTDDVGLINPRRGEPGQPLLVPEGVDRLDRFTAALKERGIRWFLEGWTLRSFRAEEGVPAPQGLPLGNKIAPFVWSEWTQARKDWFRALWGRTNPHTGLRYADDPATVMVEVANEDSLLVYWHTGALEKLPARHRQRLDERWNAWLRGKYGDDAAVNRAWNGRMRAGLQPGETLALDSIAREPAARGDGEYWPQPRAADLAQFYQSLERAHYADMAAFLRNDMGFRAPLACNTSFSIPLADATTDACEATDLHVYWDPQPESLVFTDLSMLAHPLHGRVLERASSCREGQLCTVSELNGSFPNRHGQEMPLAWAALGSRQDWDLVAWFAWSHAALQPAGAGEPMGSWDLQGRENVLAQLPVARKLWVEGGIPRAARSFVRWWSDDGLLRDLAEPPGLWLDPQAGPTALADTRLRTSFAGVPPLAERGVGEVSPGAWDADHGRMTIVTDTVQAGIGEGRGAAGLLDVDVGSFAAVSLASWDATPLVRGPRALLTAVGRAERAGTAWSRGPGLLALGRGPVRLERLRGTVRLRWPHRPVLAVLDGDGQPTRRLVTRGNVRAGWSIPLESLESPWVEVR